VIGLALQLSLSSDFSLSTRNVLFATRSLCILLSGVITIGAILCTRLLDPDGEGHQGKSATGESRTGAMEASLALSDLEWKFENLEQRCKKFESMEEKYKMLKIKYKEAVPTADMSEVEDEPVE